MSEIERHSKEIYEKEKENDLVVFLYACVSFSLILVYRRWLLEEEDQNVRLYDERGKVIFNGFGAIIIEMFLDSSTQCSTHIIYE